MMRIRIESGDCLEVMRRMADAGETVDAIVTDPPYHLTTNKKGGSGVASINLDSPYGRSRIGTGNGSGGFMGQQWDGGDVAHRAETWEIALSLLKPGGHLLAFGGTRTYHRLAAAIEDAGFEIRDQLAWMYGSGFPKSHNLDGGWQGWGTALKPAWEPIVLARKPLDGTVAANVLQHGTGALNIDGCRVGDGPSPSAAMRANGEASTSMGWRKERPAKDFEQVAASWKAERPGELLGRWPANVIHDGSEEVLGLFPESDGQQGDVRGDEPSEPLGANTYGRMKGRVPQAARGDSGSAARFFYCAKADEHDRWGSRHPTVKPVALMRWLVRLVTPPDGIVLDPFAGSGTTGVAAIAERKRAILVEREPEYLADIRERIAFYEGEGRHSIAAKARKRAEKSDDLPLFAETSD